MQRSKASEDGEVEAGNWNVASMDDEDFWSVPTGEAQFTGDDEFNEELEDGESWNQPGKLDPSRFAFRGKEVESSQKDVGRLGHIEESTDENKTDPVSGKKVSKLSIDLFEQKATSPVEVSPGPLQPKRLSRVQDLQAQLDNEGQQTSWASKAQQEKEEYERLVKEQLARRNEEEHARMLEIEQATLEKERERQLLEEKRRIREEEIRAIRRSGANNQSKFEMELLAAQKQLEEEAKRKAMTPDERAMLDREREAAEKERLLREQEAALKEWRLKQRVFVVPEIELSEKKINFIINPELGINSVARADGQLRCIVQIRKLMHLVDAPASLGPKQPCVLVVFSDVSVLCASEPEGLRLLFPLVNNWQVVSGPSLTDRSDAPPWILETIFSLKFGDLGPFYFQGSSEDEALYWTFMFKPIPEHHGQQDAVTA